MKTTPIPVKFDRQGHSCNFYAGFGPTNQETLASLLRVADTFSFGLGFVWNLMPTPFDATVVSDIAYDA